MPGQHYVGEHHCDRGSEMSHTFRHSPLDHGEGQLRVEMEGSKVQLSPSEKEMARDTEEGDALGETGGNGRSLYAHVHGEDKDIISDDVEHRRRDCEYAHQFRNTVVPGKSQEGSIQEAGDHEDGIPEDIFLDQRVECIGGPQQPCDGS